LNERHDVLRTVKAAQEWNNTPTTLRDLDTYALFRVEKLVNQYSDLSALEFHIC